MHPTLKRILLFLSVLAAGLCGYAFVFSWMYIAEHNEFFAERRQIERMLDRQLAATPPKGVSKEAWDDLCGFAAIGVANILFTPEYASVSQVVRLRTSFRQKLDADEEVTPEIIVWLWERMGECSPKAQRQATKLRPLLEDHLAPVQKQYEKQQE